MKIIVLFALFALAAANIEFYQTADDHLDMDALLANHSKLQEFLNCFEDKGPCTDLSASYKRNIPEAIETACRRCNPNQRYLFWRLIQGLKEYSPQEYWNFRNHFDPENKYFEALEKDVYKYVKPDMDLIA